MTDTETKVVAAWKEAAADLGIEFTSPFVLKSAGDSGQEYLGLVHQFGWRFGTIISVLDEPSEVVIPPEGDDYYWSILGPCYCRFDRQLFLATLDDWKFFGPANERPEWYSGKNWS